MKKGILACVIASSIIGNPLSFNLQTSKAIQQASITGRISPPEGSDFVWVLGATDSLRAGVAGGNFSLQVKPGNYKLFVNAKTPYKSAWLGNLAVKENQVLDVGEIILQK